MAAAFTNFLIATMISIFEHTQQSYATAIRQALGKGYEHACLLYSEWYRQGSATHRHPAFANAQKLYEAIREITDWSLPTVSPRHSQESTQKFLTFLPDQYEIESVAIAMKFGWSLCVSSQVGCRMGCTFCQTGRMGLLRHLSTKEIVSQLFNAKHILKYDVRNIVFMGMGEPMDNFDAVKQAVAIFTDPSGFNLAKRHITISTSGRIDGIKRMEAELDPAVNLAVSVNAPNNSVRTRLMPINRKYNMEKLHEAMREYCSHPRREILIEYVLIKGHTDSLEDAAQLASYLQGLRVKVNLIPYNPQNPDPFASPDPAQIDAFAGFMRQAGYGVLVRQTKGERTMAACGQLGNVAFKRTLKTRECHA